VLEDELVYQILKLSNIEIIEEGKRNGDAVRKRANETFVEPGDRGASLRSSGKEIETDEVPISLIYFLSNNTDFGLV
jgi:hypothetical protein